MRSSSKKFIQYISEAGFASTVPSKQKPTSGKKREKNTNILIDPSLMGSEKIGGIVGTPGEEAKAVADIGLGPLKAAIGIGGLGGSILSQAKQVTTGFQRGVEEVKAQQEAIRNMTGVENYYKNLGIKTIPMHKKDESILGTIKGLLGLGKPTK